MSPCYVGVHCEGVVFIQLVSDGPWLLSYSTNTQFDLNHLSSLLLCGCVCAGWL